MGLTGLITLLPEIVDSSSDIGSLTASFPRCVGDHLLFWAIIVNSNIYCLFRHLSDHVYLVPSKLLILAIRLGQVCRGIVLSVAVRVLPLLFTWHGNKNINSLITSQAGAVFFSKFANQQTNSCTLIKANLA